MAWDAGAMVGRIVLDKSGYTTPLRQAVGEAQTAQPQIAQALASPLRQATVAGAGLTAEMGSLRRAVGLSAVAGAGLGVALNSAFQSAIGSLRSLLSMIGDFIVGGLKSAAAYEATLLSFETMLGSADRAAQLMADLRQFAAETPFELPTLSDATKKLLAYGVSQEKIIDTLRRLGDISAATEKPLGDLSDIYGKVLSKGKMQAEEMNQFIERGVPVARVLADAYGKSTDEIMRLASEGRIGFAQLEFAIGRLTDKGGMFGGGMQKLSQGLSGLWSTLADEWADAQRQFGQAIERGVDGKSLLSELTRQISDLKPAIVELATASVAALNSMMPVLHAFTDTIKYNVSLITGATGTPLGKGGGFAPVATSSSLDAATGTAPDVERLMRVMGNTMKQFDALNTGLGVRRDSDVSTAMSFTDPGLQEEIAKLQTQAAREATTIYEPARQRLVAMREGLKNGIAPDPSEFASTIAGLKRFQEIVERLREAYARMNNVVQISPITSQVTRDAMNETSAVLREMFADSSRAMQPFADRSRGQETQPSNDKPAPSVSTIAPPPLRTPDSPDKSPGGKEVDTFGDMFREAERMKLESEGRIAEAEKMQLKHWYDTEAAKTATLGQRIALQALAIQKLAKIEKEEAERRINEQERVDREAEKSREEQLREEKRAANERERLYNQILQRQRGDLSELDQLSVSDRAAAYASQSRLVTFGPSVTSAIDRILPPSQAAGSRPAGSPASPGGSSTQGQSSAELQAIRDEVKLLHATTLRNIETNTKQNNLTVVRF